MAVPQASRAVLDEDTAIVIRPRAAASALLLVVLAATIHPLLAAGEPQAQSASPLDRYGVWITASDPSLGPLETARRVLDQLGLRWYVGFDHDPDAVPPGANKVMALPTRSLESEASIRDAARKRPGSYWLIG